MNFKNIVFSIILLTLQFGFSQSKITGKILDLNNLPIEGAHIRLTDQEQKQKGTTSNTKGDFTIDVKNNGKYNFNVTFIGYETYSKELTVNGNQNLGNIILKESAEVLQSVEVIGRKRSDYNSDYSFSATKVAIKNKDLPQTVATVTKELIDDKVAFQLSDAVKGVSSVTPVSMYNHFNIRGITQNEEGQVINGMRTRQHYFLQPLTQNIERVEVVKGPNSVTFSSADPGGTVNMVTKKPLAETKREVTFGAGSFNTLRAGLDFTGALNEDKTLLYRFNGAVQQANSYRDLVQNDALLLSPSFSYIPNDKTSVNVEMIYSNATGNLDRGQPVYDQVDGEYDLYSTPISTNIAASNDFNKTSEFIITTSLSHRFTDKIQFNGKYMKQTWKEDLQEHRANGFISDVDGNTISNLVRFRYAERKQFWNTDNVNLFVTFDLNFGKYDSKFVIGYDLHRYDKAVGGGNNQARGYLTDNDGNDITEMYGDIEILSPAAGYFDLDNPSNIIRNTNAYELSTGALTPQLLQTEAAYIQNVTKIKNFTLLFSLRNEWFKDDYNYTSSEGSVNRFTALIPRVGLSYEINPNLNVYATYLEGFQPHAYTTGLMPSVANYFWNDSRLSILSSYKPLTSSLEEIGVKSRLFNGKVNASLAAYRIRQKNVLLVNTDTDNELGLEINQRGEDRTQGIEFDVNGQFLNNLQVSISGSYIDAQIIESDDATLIGERIENTPELSGSLWAKYDFKSTSIIPGVSIGAGVDYSGEKLGWYDRDLILPGYTTVDAAAYYKPNNSKLEFTFKVNNLLDETYWTGALNSTRLFPGAPRNFMFTTAFKF